MLIFVLNMQKNDNVFARGAVFNLIIVGVFWQNNNLILRKSLCLFIICIFRILFQTITLILINPKWYATMLH